MLKLRHAKSIEHMMHVAYMSVDNSFCTPYDLGLRSPMTTSL